jgi:hypothetical protein
LIVQSRYSLGKVVLPAVLVLLLLDTVTAQVVRRPRAVQPINPPVPAVVNPPAAVPVEPAPVAVPAENANRAPYADPPGRDIPDLRQQGRIIRGSQLIGLRVRGLQDEGVGIVKDVVIDYQEGCPRIYTVVSSELSGIDGYVIVPWDAINVRYDDRARSSFIALNLGLEQLRHAPLIAANAWDRLYNAQFLNKAHQYYQRTERSAAKPANPADYGPRDTGIRSDTGVRTETQRQGDTSDRRSDVGAGSNTGTPSDAGTGRDSDAARRPEAPPTPAPSRTDTGTRNDRGATDSERQHD